ncbi:hypothetical protein [Neorhizobium alkalisoli]|uniref:Uncharacterized protein n=1 Tax=Neorhizobium alkalisoli TaxID=528178 RepID=A0A561QB36_9HYPH|nr:hypothetical protein [Neorhizobium alkalisoli]TWF47575.1 hypothetical protein FHW37_11178 [Neorhizobium alkalisoli]
MVQVVFVHGVANRKSDEGFDDNVVARDRRFQQIAFQSEGAKIRNPYWGEYGADPQWKLASVPKFTATYQPLNIGASAGSNTTIVEAAKSDFPAVVGALSVVALAQAKADQLEAEEKFWAAAARYASGQPNPAWLPTVTTDAEFYERLRKEAEAGAAIQGLGILDKVKAAAEKLKGGASNLVNGPIARAGREKITPGLAIFIGDVFRYLREADPRQKIREVVSNDIIAAAKDLKQGEPLVLIGHSMGGIILYDLLSDPEAVAEMSGAIGRDLKVDLFLSVGSQIALFEEMKLYKASSTDYSAAGKRVPSPAVVQAWWNAFDKMDVLSFVTETVFDGPKDFSVDTVAGVRDAHGAYFLSAMFYTRLNVRLKEAGLLK